VIGSRRLRVLFLAEAVTLAHVARPFSLATALPQKQFDVIFATDNRFSALFEARDWQAFPLETISRDDFERAISSGRPIYDAATIDHYVDVDRQLIRKTRPDVIVGDFRLSLSVSARMERIPYINVTNGYWSPYAAPDWVAPDLAMTRILGTALSTRLFRMTLPLSFALHARPLDDVRARHGLSKLGDLRGTYTDGDLTLYADLPGFVPLTGAPPSHRLLGPVPWSPRIGLPDWWAELPEGRRLVYVNLGSSGKRELLPLVCDALERLGLPAVVATGPASLPDKHFMHLRSCHYIDGAMVARRARLVICNGGSPATQQALLNGAPVLGLPSNLDQFLNMNYVQRAGAGLSLRAGTLATSALEEAMREVVDSKAMAEVAARVARETNVEATYARFGSALTSLMYGL
jgi:UDP:flavonoid glycosyltransferase YjiC (YdhE family)